MIYYFLEELVKETKYIKELLDTKKFSQTDSIIYHAGQWIISNSEMYPNHIIDKELTRFECKFRNLKKKVYFLDMFNEVLLEKWIEESLRPPEHGGSEYEKCESQFISKVQFIQRVKNISGEI